MEKIRTDYSWARFLWGGVMKCSRSWWWLHNSVPYTKTYWIVHWKGWILWSMDYISTKRMMERKRWLIISFPYQITPRMFFLFSSHLPCFAFLLFSYSRAAADCHSGYNSDHRGWPSGQRGSDVPAMRSFYLEEKPFF